MDEIWIILIILAVLAVIVCVVLAVMSTFKAAGLESRTEEAKAIIEGAYPDADKETEAFLLELYIFRSKYHVLIDEGKKEKASNIARKHNQLIDRNKTLKENALALNPASVEYLPEELE